VSAEKNVEIARKAYEAATRRPKPDFDTVNALYHRDHELVSLSSRVEGGRLVGAAGFRSWLETFDEAFASMEIDIEQVRAIDEERVLLVAGGRLVGRRGGVPVEQRFAQIITVREEMVVRSEVYSSLEAALEAAG
jgi:ketosteroid isomerase-like protein